MKLLLIGFVAMILLIPVFAQKTVKHRVNKSNVKVKKVPLSCNLTLNDAPKLRGLYLGQSYKEISKIIPKFEQTYLAVTNETNAYKDSDIDVRIISSYQVPSLVYPNFVTGFDDISINLHFYNGKLVSLYITYDEFEPETIQNLIIQVAEKTGLPKDSFKIKDKYKAELICNGFTVNLNMGAYTRFNGYEKSPPEILVEDIEANLQLEKLYNEFERKKKEEDVRQKQEELKKRKVFKP
jgi:hypothetical protein